MIDYSYFRTCYNDFRGDIEDQFEDPLFDRLNSDYAVMHPVREVVGTRVSDVELLQSCQDPVSYNIVASSMRPVSAPSDPDGLSDEEHCGMVMPKDCNKSDVMRISQNAISQLSQADYSELDPVPPVDSVPPSDSE